MVVKYDWNEIQTAHDEGMTWREIRDRYGCAMGTLAKAKLRGDLQTRNLSEATVVLINRRGPNIMGSEARTKTSVRQSTNNRGGRCKWFNIGGVKVQGTWEKNIAEKLIELEIAWRRPGIEDSFLYELNGEIRRYTPDFYLPEFNYYLEIKGRWWGDDEDKMAAVMHQNPNHRIVLVHKLDYEESLMI